MPVYWRCTPTEQTPFFQITGLIDHQHRVRRTELLCHIATQVIAQVVGIPHRLAQQVLHPRWVRLTGELERADRERGQGEGELAADLRFAVAGRKIGDDLGARLAAEICLCPCTRMLTAPMSTSV